MGNLELKPKLESIIYQTTDFASIPIALLRIIAIANLVKHILSSENFFRLGNLKVEMRTAGHFTFFN
jgi:hypothetical protein